MKIVDIIKVVAKYPFFRPKPFIFNGETLVQFKAFYNFAFNNERSLEIPIVRRYLRKHPRSEVLEVGNVLQHYFRTEVDGGAYAIVDKYERGKNVINGDVLEIPRKYFHPDIIVSISTMEHIGEDVGKPELAIKAIEHLKFLLVKDGEMVCTIPIGYNRVLDKEIPKLFDEVHCYKKIGQNNEWKQAEFEDVKNTEYHGEVKAFVVGIVRK